MVVRELYERISLTLECPPCVIDPDIKNTFAYWDSETEVLVALPGVAVGLVGCSAGADCVDRSVRSAVSGIEWHYLMHFEIALNNLFAGRVDLYNYVAENIGLPQILIPYGRLVPYVWGEEELFLNNLRVVMGGIL
jgi:hypothetical protein